MVCDGSNAVDRWSSKFSSLNVPSGLLVVVPFTQSTKKNVMKKNVMTSLCFFFQKCGLTTVTTVTLVRLDARERMVSETASSNSWFVTSINSAKTPAQITP